MKKFVFLYVLVNVLFIVPHLIDRICHLQLLSGEKENDRAICRSLGALVSELQQQKADQSEVVRELHTRLSLSLLENKKSQQEGETANLKYEKLVSRLVGKTKEVSALTSEKNILFTENEAWRLQQRRENSSGSGSGSGGKKGSKKALVTSGCSEAEETLLRGLVVTYSKQVTGMQAQLDLALEQCAGGREAEQGAEKRQQVDKEQVELLTQQLERTSRELKQAMLECSKMEGKVRVRRVVFAVLTLWRDYCLSIMCALLTYLSLCPHCVALVCCAS